MDKRLNDMAKRLDALEERMMAAKLTSHDTRLTALEEKALAARRATEAGVPKI